ncbi:XRE family transcriptional regulator [Celeribacter baekdonensis]|uniref:XRE family transcriptional regulator n=1 Tax=Celeribacter baekdonensis TaxID=875171 RepID=UPI0030DAE15C|tara:strand:- start:185828 stop:186040 length:213 start_codon:yes stop_codon:yes gene_type:complete
MAKAALGVENSDFAEPTGLYRNTLKKLDKGEREGFNGPAVRLALEGMGVQFLEVGAQAEGVGVALKGAKE